MTKNQNAIMQFLSKFKSCTQEQLIEFTGCSSQDISYLIASNFIVLDDKTKLLHHKIKKVDVRTAVALDVIRLIKNEIKDCGYSKNFPVIFTTVTTDNQICDIAVVRKIEQETVFKRLKDYSRADKIIIVLENEEYDKNLINSTKEVLICKYPIQIIDKIN